jgi:glucose dehydrogenase
MDAAPPAHGFADWALRAFGALLALFGLQILAGRMWLDPLGGSLHDLLAALGLSVSGALLLIRRVEGAWLYAAVFPAILLWALWKGDLAGWPLIARVLMPTACAAILLCFAPVLRRWAARHERLLFGPMTAFLIVAGIVLVAFGIEFGATKIR